MVNVDDVLNQALDGGAADQAGRTAFFSLIVSNSWKMVPSMAYG
jgi:hypothetical protein